MLGAVGIDVEPIGQLSGRNPYSAITVRQTPGDETGAYTNDGAGPGDIEKRKEEEEDVTWIPTTERSRVHLT